VMPNHLHPIAGYKSAVLNKIDDYIDERQLAMQKFNRRNPMWQANYYDHILRNGQAYQRIAAYIRNNPMKWEEQKIELH
jgi:putative transposase